MAQTQSTLELETARLYKNDSTMDRICNSIPFSPDAFLYDKKDVIDYA